MRLLTKKSCENAPVTVSKLHFQSAGFVPVDCAHKLQKAKLWIGCFHERLDESVVVQPPAVELVLGEWRGLLFEAGLFERSIWADERRRLANTFAVF